jgi:hypothetical protein
MYTFASEKKNYIEVPRLVGLGGYGGCTEAPTQSLQFLVTINLD